jgi:hypothetical protein
LDKPELIIGETDFQILLSEPKSLRKASGESGAFDSWIDCSDGTTCKFSYLCVSEKPIHIAAPLAELTKTKSAI